MKVKTMTEQEINAYEREQFRQWRMALKAFVVMTYVFARLYIVRHWRLFWE